MPGVVDIEIRRLEQADVAIYRSIRLEGLQDGSEALETHRMTFPELGYRLNVGIMAFNPQGLVWLGCRNDTGADPEGPGTWWQMPQGGIDDGEDPARAALRELAEETGMRSVEIIAQSAGWHSYDLPPDIVGMAWGGRYRGQRQKWFAVRFNGADSEVDIAGDLEHQVEFIAWRWAPIGELAGLVVPFKRDVYAKVVAEFGALSVNR